MATLTKVSVNGQVYDLGGSSIGSSMIEITYSELKSLRDSSSLVPGQSYRITDFVTMTKPSTDYYISAGHAFDIVVTALSESKLSSNARVLLREGDDYFANSKVDEWRIKYSLDNDTKLYSYCDPNGKGVIYEMIDEYGNLALFDFKNIMSRISPSSNPNIKTDDLYFYLISHIDENTSGTISSQDHIFDATVKFNNITNNKFFITPDLEQSVVLTKTVLDDVLKTNNSIKNCEFYESVFFITLSSVSGLRLAKPFLSYYNINDIKDFKGIFTGNYPKRIEFITRYVPDTGITNISLNYCEFNMTSNNSPSLSIGVSEIVGVKVVMLEGSGGGVSVMSTKFNYSLIYVNANISEFGINTFLVDDLLPEGLTDFSGCELHLFSRLNHINGKKYSITSGYVIGKDGTLYKLKEFDSSTLDPEYTPA